MAKTPHFLCKGAWVQFLVRELRSCMPSSMGKKKKELLSNINWYEVTVFSFPSVAFTEISSVSVGVVVIVLFSGKLSLKS